MSLLTEWYLNDERGIEQGFHILAPQSPTSDSQSPPTLELALTGDLTPHLSDDQAIHFTAADSSGPAQRTPVLYYGPPRATDAAGHPLPAQVSLAPRTLRITVDDSTAS